jgi:hypothetical protein
MMPLRRTTWRSSPTPTTAARRRAGEGERTRLRQPTPAAAADRLLATEQAAPLALYVLPYGTTHSLPCLPICLSLFPFRFLPLLSRPACPCARSSF